MVDPAFPALPEWGNFYVIIGSAAGALTALMFVVIALRNEVTGDELEGGARAFGSPTVMHFCGALLVAALVSMPRHTARSLALCVAATGLAGLGLTIRVAIQARRQRGYQPVLSDWIWHVAMPSLPYAALVAAASILARATGAALDLVGGASLLLLFIGIRNAWDAAVWIAAKRP